MTVLVLSAKKSALASGLDFTAGSGDKGSSSAQTTYNTDAATVAADIATLVADGATPTQAHVTTLNTDYTALAAAYTALGSVVAQGAQTGDVVVSVNLANVSTVSQLRAAFNTILAAASGNSAFAP